VGSVLGPLRTYIEYTAYIATALVSCGAVSRLYADDIPPYLRCPANGVLTAVAIAGFVGR